MPAKKNKAVTARDILIYARALLAKRGGWTKGSYAKDKQGNAVTEDSPEACSFCAQGAIYRAIYDLGPSDSALMLLDHTFSRIGEIGLISFNDRQASKRPVIAEYDRAIQKLEASNG
jgi:hypothetical protein